MELDMIGIGERIKTRRKEVEDRYGKTKHIVEYYIPEGEPVYINILGDTPKEGIGE